MFDFSVWFDKFVGLFDSLFTFINDTITYLLGYISGLISAIFTRLFYFLHEFLEFVLSPLASFVEDSFNSVGVTELLQIYSGFSSSPISYFFDYFRVTDLLLAVLSAYILRFVIRRLPFVG
jgi:hypothetical protein